MDDDHPSADALVEYLKSTISRFNSVGICDTCNSPLSTTGDDTDYAYVYASWRAGEWNISRTNCQGCGDDLMDRERVEAIALCEVGDSTDGEFYSLYNPEVIAMNTSDGAVIRR